MTNLLYASIALRGSTYILLVKEGGGQPSPKEFIISKPQIAALLAGAAWALYEDLLKCDQHPPTAPNAETSAKR